jgi:hypothetical protein
MRMSCMPWMQPPDLLTNDMIVKTLPCLHTCTVNAVVRDVSQCTRPQSLHDGQPYSEDTKKNGVAATPQSDGPTCCSVARSCALVLNGCSRSYSVHTVLDPFTDALRSQRVGRYDVFRCATQADTLSAQASTARCRQLMVQHEHMALER